MAAISCRRPFKCKPWRAPPSGAMGGTRVGVVRGHSMSPTDSASDSSYAQRAPRPSLLCKAAAAHCTRMRVHVACPAPARLHACGLLPGAPRTCAAAILRMCTLTYRTGGWPLRPTTARCAQHSSNMVGGSLSAAALPAWCCSHERHPRVCACLVRCCAGGRARLDETQMSRQQGEGGARPLLQPATSLMRRKAACQCCGTGCRSTARPVNCSAAASQPPGPTPP